VKLAGGAVEAFLRKPDPAVRLVLVYGNDAGLVRERADRLHKAVVPALDDPFRVARLTGAKLAEDPARLGDEAAALAFGGGRRVVRVTDVNDAQGRVLADFAQAPIGDALVIVEVDGTPGKSSPLRRAAESADAAIAIACYEDEGDALERLVGETLGAAGLAADDEAMAYLVAHLGGDRLLTRRELEKLALYAGTEGRTRAEPITLAEASAVVGDTAHLTFDDLAAAVADGDMKRLDRLVQRLAAEGVNPVALLRVVSGHFRRLHQFMALVAAGRPAASLLPQFRLWGPRARRFEAQARRWDAPALAEAFRRLNEAESRCKSTGMPDALIAARALAGLAQLGQRLGRAR
jgi:DNA polymerase-3 subunit delta